MICASSFLQKTSFILFLNKFDLFEKKVLKVRLQLFFIFYFFLSLDNFHEIGWDILCGQVPLNVCEWFKDYQPVSTEKQEIEHAYE